ncbi:cobalamin biosynthesis protein CbiB [mine drainage metagenome]|uniref:Cobalamin biosynthesis protein CbiB n=1 Tax=mine drainage metagenome TaxID=410659 RepID=A0A1J5QGF4_9ZZZZ
MLSFAHYPTSPLVVLAAVLLDRLLGEPARWHPLVGFGRLANVLEARCNRPCRQRRQRLVGAVAVAVLIAPACFAAAWLSAQPWGLLCDVLLLYSAIGARSLAQHAEAVAAALRRDDLPSARHRVGRMVSRNTADLPETGIARATVESVLENGSDAVFGALFWFVVLGAPGAVLFRLANTLDAMWGYRTVRFLHFGWAAARLDDVLGYIPARLTALSYALLGNFRRGIACWMKQARHWYSPNAGPVMAAGAGALQLTLGGVAQYHGAMKQRPILGEGNSPASADIERAVALVQRSLILWVVIIFLGGWFLA